MVTKILAMAKWCFNFLNKKYIKIPRLKIRKIYKVYNILAIHNDK